MMPNVHTLPSKTADNTAYTLRADGLCPFRDIAPVGRNVVYAGDVI